MRLKIEAETAIEIENAVVNKMLDMSKQASKQAARKEGVINI